MADVLWRGPSRIDGEEIVVLAQGLDRPSSNEKTGRAVQVSYIPAATHAWEAVVNGAAKSVCGTCPLYVSSPDLADIGRTCYVAPPFVITLSRTLKTAKPLRGRYATHRMTRLGAFGDPAAAPWSVTQALINGSRTWTGFTRRWRELGANAPEKNAFMASCFTPQEAADAQAMGWRTYRVLGPDETAAKNEVMCPFYTRQVTCERCLLCRGASLGAKNIVAPSHGPGRTDKFVEVQNYLKQREDLIQIQ